MMNRDANNGRSAQSRPEGIKKHTAFFTSVMAGMEAFLVLDRSNPVYLANQLWKSGADGIDTYREAMKAKVVITGRKYSSPVSSSHPIVKENDQITELLNRLCVVDDISRDLFLEVFRYTLSKFIMEKDAEIVSLKKEDAEYLVKSFKEFFYERPICMGIKLIPHSDVIQLSSPQEGYLEGKRDEECIEFPSVFFSIPQTLSSTQRVDTTMLLLFTSSFLDFFSMVKIGKRGVINKTAKLEMTRKGPIYFDSQFSVAAKGMAIAHVVREMVALGDRRWNFVSQHVTMIDGSYLPYGQVRLRELEEDCESASHDLPPSEAASHSCAYIEPKRDLGSPRSSETPSAAIPVGNCQAVGLQHSGSDTPGEMPSGSMEDATVQSWLALDHRSV